MTDTLKCPRCGERPTVAQDADGLWDVIHFENWFVCGTPMALNYETRDAAVEAWNSMMIRRMQDARKDGDQ